MTAPHRHELSVSRLRCPPSSHSSFFRHPASVATIRSNKLLVVAFALVASAILLSGFSSVNAGAKQSSLSGTEGSWTTAGSLNTVRVAQTATLLPNGKVLIVGGYTQYSIFIGDLSAISSAELYDPATDTWSMTGSLSTARVFHTATLLPNGKVLVVGGADDSFGSLKSAELYDPATGAWSATGSMHFTRSSHTATLLPSGKVLVAGGQGGSDNAYRSPTSAELYDPATGTWSLTGALHSARSGHTAIPLPNGKVLVLGGVDDNRYPLGSAELYDPTSGTWSVTSAPNTVRSLNTATLLANGKVLITGEDNTGDLPPNAELYDPASGTWSATGSLNTAGYFQTATLLPSGKVLVAGAVTNTELSGRSAELYDPATGKWSVTASFNTARFGYTATLLQNGKVLAVGGTREGIVIATTELYDSGAGAWSITGSLDTGRLGHTATLLPNGRVLVAGGYTAGPDSSSVLSSTVLYDPATGTWSTTGSLNTARFDNSATLLPNGKVLVAGGYDSNIGVTASAELYDPISGKWTTTGSLKIPRIGHTATLLTNGKVLVVSGFSRDGDLAGNSASAELYDPASGTWSLTGSLNTAHEGHTATLLPNGKVLVLGGSNASVELYDPASGTWSVTGSLNIAPVRIAHTATLLPNGKVLVVGGESNVIGETATHITDAELYDPATGKWRTTGSINTARVQNTATLLPNGKVLIAGGFAGSNHTASAELYDPATGTWSAASSLNNARDFHTATLLPNGKVLVVGGFNDVNFETRVELYDPSVGTWNTTGSLNTARYNHTATLLPNGKVLVTGGQADGFSSDYLASAELYDPATGTWSQTGSLSTARQNHTATLLPNGKVLVVGGRGGNNQQYNLLNSAELYDPATGTWSATGSLKHSRVSHTATLLRDGKVLVIGGMSDFGFPTESAEVYDPATGTWTEIGSGPRLYSHTTTLLPSGKVLIAGGRNVSDFPIRGAELFDPATGTFIQTGDLNDYRAYHTATLLPNGKVLVAGGATDEYTLDSAELYDPATGKWTRTGTLPTVRLQHKATLLPNGKVLVSGGDFSSDSADLYDPATGEWNATANLNTAQGEQTATLLPNGKVLVVGGSSNFGHALASAELYDVGLGFAASSQPVITSVTSPLNLPDKLVLTGTRFRGISGSSSDNTQNSATNYPVVQLFSLGNEQTLYLSSDSTSNWSDTSFTSQTIKGFPSGYALATVFTNGIPSDSKLIQITGLVTSFSNLSSPTVSFGTPNTTLSGKISAGSSIPTGNVSITFNGVTQQAAIRPNGTFSASFATGSLTVNGSPYPITYSYAGDSNYESVTDNQRLIVSKATASITLSNLSQTYDGQAKAPTVQTSPAGLSYTLTYSQHGQPIASPITIGDYDVTATITDPNYQGSASGIMVINRAAPVVIWNNPAHITFGTPLSAAQLNATANTAGTFTYNPPAGTVLDVGTHQLSVTFTPTDIANYTNATASVSITVDQGTVISLSSANYSVNEGDGHAIITVVRTGDLSGTTSINYATSDSSGMNPCSQMTGMASQRCDYAVTVGTLKFAAGETTKSIFIPIIDDAYVEGPETFNVTLSNPVGAALQGSAASATIIITDNDVAGESNPLNQDAFFIRQLYIDFLDREPDAAGLQGWLNILKGVNSTQCVLPTDCDRIAVALGFIRSPEFTDRGYFIYRLYKTLPDATNPTFGRIPHYSEFITDMAKVSGFLSTNDLNAAKDAFIQEFMNRQEFRNQYEATLNDPTTYVDSVLRAVNLPQHPSRNGWIAGLTNGTLTRAQVLRQVVESAEVSARFKNEAFVIMNYFGFLRRDADAAFMTWIQTFNNTNNERLIAGGFLNSSEFRQRFAP